MDTEDLGSKKINHEEFNEGFCAENLPEDYNPGPAKLKQELETGIEGDKDVVARARNTGGTAEPSDRNGDENERTAKGDEMAQRSSENRDRNSDITANRYPNTHPDNHINRGNIGLDENLAPD
jgi:hypothetical protein